MGRGELPAPFFIVGAPRSGSTLLRRILLASPELHIPPETHVLGAAIHDYRRHRHWEWAALARLVLSHFVFQRGFDAFQLPSLPSLASEANAIPPAERSAAALINSFYLHHAALNGRESARWGDKSPYNSFCLDDIATVFPAAQYVHIVRDAFDVTASLMQAGLAPNAGVAVERWATSVRAVQVFQAQHPAQVLVVRYEDLVQSPEPTIATVCRFLDVKPSPGMLTSERIAEQMGDVAMHAHHRAVREPISSISVGKGRRSLLPEDYRTVAARARTTLEQLGYERE